MAINKKLIHFQTLANFNAQLSAGNILDTSICFIKDAKKIWTHGEFYNCENRVENTSDIYVWELGNSLEMGSSGYVSEEVHENLCNAKSVVILSNDGNIDVAVISSLVMPFDNDVVINVPIIGEASITNFIITVLGSNYSYTIGGNTIPLTDTTNTAGASDSSSKLYLVGATSQSASAQTYTHDTAYVGTNGYLYSNKEKVDMRLTTSLVPQGTQIPANADLNSVDYVKVGKYFCESNADAATLSNCPCTEGFMMEVYSPLSVTIDNETTSRYIYRLRVITSYRKGIQFKQLCSVSATANQWTYDPWNIVPQSSISATGDTPIKKGDVTNGVYINERGEFTPMQYYLYKTVPYNAEFTDTKVTAVGNHYTPSANANSELVASGGTLTDLSSSSEGIQVITGLRRDAAGHVVGVNSVALTVSSSGGLSGANVQAVNTGDVVDDVNVSYATTEYVNGLVGDINSVLESIINGGSTPALIDNYLTYMSTMIEDTSSYYFLLEYPAESDLVIQATYGKPNIVNGTFQGYVDVTEEYHIDKGNMNINEKISDHREFTNVSITPEYDNVYRYIYNA